VEKMTIHPPQVETLMLRRVAIPLLLQVALHDFGELDQTCSECRSSGSTHTGDRFRQVELFIDSPESCLCRRASWDVIPRPTCTYKAQLSTITRGPSDAAQRQPYSREA